MAALNSQHRAACGILGAAAQQTGTIQLQYMHPLTPDLNQAAHLVRSTKGVPEAFHPLGQLPAIWTTKSFNYLNDIRKSWCTEEAINYIQGIASQWQEISLHWHPTVVRSIDPDSIRMLQSRAPQLSKADHDYIVHTFERGQILPQLTDKTLREAVKTAVCRQGPILTLTTFAEDVRLLLSRVHRALTPILGGMRRARHDTLRKRVKRVLEREFDMLSQPGRISIASTLQKEVLIDRCYQHVFLHTIRAALPEGSVNITQLRNLLKQEIHRFRVDDITPSLCNPDGDENDIAIDTPANTSSRYPDSEDVDVMRRHGVSLFKSATATSLLYYDQIHTRDPPELLLSQPSMAKHIVRVFLFGITSGFEADLLPPNSPTVSLDPFHAMLENLPFRDRGTASLCTADDRDSISGLSSHAASESELDAASVLWRRPHIQTVSVRSQARSIVGQKTSAVDTTHSTECMRKRPPPIFTMNATQDRDFSFPSTPSKRRRSRNMSSYKPTSSVPSVGVWSPEWSPKVSREDFCIESPFSSTHQQRISSVNHWRGSLESTVEKSSPKTIITNSPSIYSPNRRPLTPQVMNSRIICRSDPMEAYTELLYHSNPFLSDGVTTVNETQVDQAGPLREDNQSTSTSQIDLPYHSQTGRLAVDSLPVGAVVPRAPRDSTVIVQVEADRPVKSGPRSILYKSSLKPGMFYRAPVDARSTERLVQSQKSIDPLSRFGYKLKDNDTMRYAATYDQLYQAIERYGLETVFVISERLGSTEHPTAAVYTSSSLTRPRLR
ncbi:hypothetical protein BKA66DRAFT_599163 [Pyrenochaeta sp. MPI-SDFR-AT-0127]|nr:hypothetical protein BKA66DRAFT_599163 [Pyrenochaeta sp. MPI-SDFR-AT-0127]